MNEFLQSSKLKTVSITFTDIFNNPSSFLASKKMFQSVCSSIFSTILYKSINDFSLMVPS